MDRILTENCIKSKFKRNDRIKRFVKTTKLSDFRQFKTKTYVYWRFNMIIRKGNAVVRSLRKKKLFEVMKEYGDL